MLNYTVNIDLQKRGIRVEDVDGATTNHDGI
jgi:hypothetical protein